MSKSPLQLNINRFRFVVSHTTQTPKHCIEWIDYQYIQRSHVHVCKLTFLPSISEISFLMAASSADSNPPSAIKLLTRRSVINR